MYFVSSHIKRIYIPYLKGLIEAQKYKYVKIDRLPAKIDLFFNFRYSNT